MLVPIAGLIRKVFGPPVSTADQPHVGTFQKQAPKPKQVKVTGPRVDLAETEPADFWEVQGQPIDWDEEHEDVF